MAADGLAPSIARSAAMVIIIWDKRIFVVDEDWY